MSTELIEKAESILAKLDLPDRHTYFQLEKFVIGKEPTAQAQLWQIVRELEARLETIDSYKEQLEEAEDELELFDVRIERLDRKLRKQAQVEGGTYTDLNMKQLEINIRKLQRRKQSLIQAARKTKHKLGSRIEEIGFLVEAYEKIVSHYGEMKPIDDNQAQMEMWNEKLLEEFNLRVILQRPLDPEFIKTVLCLDDGAPVKQHTVRLIQNIQQRMIPNRKPEIEAKAKVTGG